MLEKILSRRTVSCGAWVAGSISAIYLLFLTPSTSWPQFSAVARLLAPRKRSHSPFSLQMHHLVVPITHSSPAGSPSLQSEGLGGSYVFWCFQNINVLLGVAKQLLKCFVVSYAFPSRWISFISPTWHTFYLGKLVFQYCIQTCSSSACNSSDVYRTTKRDDGIA